MSKLFIPAGCVVEGEIVALQNIGDIEIEGPVSFRTLASQDGCIKVHRAGESVTCEELCAEQGEVAVSAHALTCDRLLAADVDLKVDRLTVPGSIVTSGKLLVESDEGLMEAMSGREAELEVGHLTVQSINVEGELSMNTDHARIGEIRAARVIIRGTIECQRIVATEAVIVEAGSVSVKYLDSPCFHAAPAVTGIVAVATSEDVRAEGVRGFLHPGELDMLSAVDAPVARVDALPSEPSPSAKAPPVAVEAVAELSDAPGDAAEIPNPTEPEPMAVNHAEGTVLDAPEASSEEASDSFEESQDFDGEGDALYEASDSDEAADSVEASEPDEAVDSDESADLDEGIAADEDDDSPNVDELPDQGGVAEMPDSDEVPVVEATLAYDDTDAPYDLSDYQSVEPVESHDDEAAVIADDFTDEPDQDEAEFTAESTDEDDPLEDPAQTEAEAVDAPPVENEDAALESQDDLEEIEDVTHEPLPADDDFLSSEDTELRPIEIDTDDLDGADLYMDSDEVLGDEYMAESMDGLDGESLLVQDLNDTLNRIRAFFPADGVPKFIDQIGRYLEEGRFNLFGRENNKRAVLSSFDKYDHDEISRLAREFFDRLEGFVEAPE